MNLKSLTRVEIKDADKGEIAAVFSTFDVVDHDGDVTVKGAFSDGQPVAISAYGHASSLGTALPVGKGRVRELKTEAVLEGRFLLDTQGGVDTFRVVKAMSEPDGPGQEWSYAYDVRDSELGDFNGKRVRFLKGLWVREVSPVLVGAGIDTRTLAAKGIPHTTTSDGGVESFGTTEGMTFSEHAKSVLADVDALITRATEVVALRAAKGKALAESSADLLHQLDGSLNQLKALLDTPTPHHDELAREYARFVALSQGVTIR